MTTAEKITKYFPLRGNPSVEEFRVVSAVAHKTNPAVFGHVLMADGEMVLRLVSWKKNAKEMTDKWKECDDSIWESFDRISLWELWTRETMAMEEAHR